MGELIMLVIGVYIVMKYLPKVINSFKDNSKSE